MTDATDTVDYEVTAGTYSVTEAALAGWDVTGNTCTGLCSSAGHGQLHDHEH